MTWTDQSDCRGVVTALPATRSRHGGRLPQLSCCAALLLALGGCTPDGPGRPISTHPGGMLDLDAPALAAEIAAGRLSAETVTEAALARIRELDDDGPELNAILEINPDSLAIARELDLRYAAGGVVGPLHGIPVVLKANIDTGDAMATSAGSIALANHRASVDAPLVARLRAAGAVIIAKANLSEWANFRSRRSTSGWSSLGGQTRNPYHLDRNPCGSSSGSAVAVAARLVPFAVGTETDGSIVCPAAINGIVGIKPTIGLIEQTGIIPISSTQDTAGPMARTVRGAAMLLDALRNDVATRRGGDAWPPRKSLDGVRIGVLRDYSGAGTLPAVETAYQNAIDLLDAEGGDIVDGVTLDLPPDVGTAEFEVLLHEFRAGLNAYLATVESGPNSLAALIAFNTENAETAMPVFGQDLLEEAEARGGLDDPRYLSARDRSHVLVRDRLEREFAATGVNVLLAPANSPAWPTDPANGDRMRVSSSNLAAVSGYPSIVVPAAMVDGLPVAIAFIGRPFAEAELIGIAAVFEAARGEFPAPAFVPGD